MCRGQIISQVHVSSNKMNTNNMLKGDKRHVDVNLWKCLEVLTTFSPSNVNSVVERSSLAPVHRTTDEVGGLNSSVNRFSQ